MKNLLTLYAFTAILSGLLIITGCSSSDEGSSSGGGVTVPANAILIDNSATAESTTVSAVATGHGFVGAFGIQTSAAHTAKDIIDIIFDKIPGNFQNTQAIVSGVDLSSELCLTGTASGDATETSSSFSASATLNACEVAPGLFFTGSMVINSTFSTTTGAYSDTASGNLSVYDSGSGISIGFNGFNYAETGNENSGDYTVSTFTYAIDPSTGGGYAVQVTQPLVGNFFEVCELTSGQVLISGASGSQARGTVNPDRSVTVEYHSGDGNFIPTDNSPLPCLI